MEKKVVYTEKAPEPGPYSQAIQYGNLIFVAGQTSEDPETNRPVHDSVTAQTERIMKNIRTILEAAGSGLDKIVRADIYLSSLDIKPEFNEAYLKFFPERPPARNCVAVAGIDDGLDVEIEVIAGV
ncbi:MAG: RidA family protein [Desulfobacterales bacterium]